MYKILASRDNDDFIIEHEGKLKHVDIGPPHFSGQGIPAELEKNELRKLLRDNFQQHIPPDEVRDTMELEDILRLFPEVKIPEDYHKAITLFRDGKKKTELSEWDQLWNERELFQKK